MLTYIFLFKVFVFWEHISFDYGFDGDVLESHEIRMQYSFVINISMWAINFLSLITFLYRVSLNSSFLGLDHQSEKFPDWTISAFMFQAIIWDVDFLFAAHFLLPLPSFQTTLPHVQTA